MNARTPYPMLYRIAYAVDWRCNGGEWTVATYGTTDINGDERDAARRFAEAYADSGQPPAGATVRARVWRNWSLGADYLARSDWEICDGEWQVAA